MLDVKKNITLLGDSVDDALGETFDKIAKILKLKYPGGPEIESYAIHGNERSFNLPIPILKDNTLNMSFSGIKTAINLLVKKNVLSDDFVANMSASFQFCITKILLDKVSKVIKKLKKDSIDISSISIVGGVANNKYILNKFTDFAKNENLKIFIPLKDMMSDNAAMIAWACMNQEIIKDDLLFKPNPRLTI